jgi:hypothetical protein
MRQETIIDAVMIVGRWYGGTLLGPARFDHVETCAREVCPTFKRKKELEYHLSESTLGTLDDILADLCAELTNLSSESPTATSASISAKDISPRCQIILQYTKLITSPRRRGLFTPGRTP